MTYVNPYDIAENISFDLAIENYKRFKKRVSAELELNSNQIKLYDRLYQQNDIYEMFDVVDKDKNILHIYNAIYENKELNIFLYGKQKYSFLKNIKTILALEDANTLKFITPFLVENIAITLKKIFLSNEQNEILSINLPLDNTDLEKVYEPIYKILKNRENELKSLKNGTYDVDVVRKIAGNIETINALPEYFTKVRDDTAFAIRNLSIDSWNENEDLDTAMELIDLALRFKLSNKIKDKFLSDKRILEEIKRKQEQLIAKIIREGIQKDKEEKYSKYGMFIGGFFGLSAGFIGLIAGLTIGSIIGVMIAKKY